MKTTSLRLVAIGMVALISSASIFFASCKKESNETTAKTPSANPTIGSDLNGLTPLSAGDYHNAAMWYISDHTQDLGALGSMTNFNEYSNSLMMFSQENQIGWTDLTQPYVQSVIDQAKAGVLVDNLFDQQRISLPVRNSLNNMLNTLAASPTHQDGQAFLNQYIQQVSGSQEFTAAEKDLLVGSASVAIGSSNFWIDAYNNPQSVWHRTATEEGQPKYAGKVKWWKLLADVGGFIAGDLVGGPAVGVGCAGLASACVD